MALARTTMVSHNIPEPLEADPEDVRWALATAQRLATTGDRDAAVRWVRRAVSAALEHKQVERATELDRAAQLLENELHAGAEGANTPGVPSTERGTGGEIKPPTPPVRELAPTLQDITTGAKPLGTAPGANRPRAVVTPVPKAKFDFDDEATVVSTPHDLVLATEATMRLEAVPPMPTGSAGAGAAGTGPQSGSSPTAPSPASAPFPPSTDHEPTVLSRPAVRDTLEELRIPEGLREEAAAVSSDTMTSFSRFRVALLASSDDEHPRAISLRPDEKAPPGAGVGYLIADTEEDREAIAILLGLQKP